MDVIAEIQRVIDIEIEALRSVRENVSPQFEEAVEIFAETKRAVGGVEVPKIDIAKDQSEGTLSFAAAPQATPGEHEWIIKSRVKFKDLTLEDNLAIKIKINQVEPQASN